MADIEQPFFCLLYGVMIIREEETRMNKICQMVFLVLVMIPLSACGKSAKIDAPQADNYTVVVDNAEAAREKTGIDFKIPEEDPEGYSKGLVSVLDERILQIIYHKSEDEIVYRTGITEADEETVSGTRENFQEIDEVAVGKLKVILYGNGEEIYFAGWSDGEYSYSLSSEQEFTLDQIHAIIDSI